MQTGVIELAVWAISEKAMTAMYRQPFRLIDGQRPQTARQRNPQMQLQGLLVIGILSQIGFACTGPRDRIPQHPPSHTASLSMPVSSISELPAIPSTAPEPSPSESSSFKAQTEIKPEPHIDSSLDQDPDAFDWAASENDRDADQDPQNKKEDRDNNKDEDDDEDDDDDDDD